MCPSSRSGSEESTPTTVKPVARSRSARTGSKACRYRENRSPKCRRKCTYPTFRESWFPGMTTFGASRPASHSAACSNSHSYPAAVRSPATTATSEPPSTRVTHSLVKALRTVPDLAALDDRTLLRIVGGSVNLFWPAGTSVFEKGEPAEALYVVLAGQVRIFDVGD